jgi:hypothetical protein
VINPSIILAGRAPQIDSPLDTYGKALTLKSVAQSQDVNAERLRQMQMETAAAEQAQRDDAAARDIYANNTSVGANGLPTLNKEATLADLYKAGNIKGATALQTQITAQQKAALDAHKLQLENIAAANKVVAQYLGSVRNAAPEAQAAQYAAARQAVIARAAELHVDPASIPEQFDPAWVETHFQAAIEGDKQVTAAQKALADAETARNHLATETETKRHNVVGEQNAANVTAETGRHNSVTEKETGRHNVQTEKTANAQVAVGQQRNAIEMTKANAATNSGMNDDDFRRAGIEYAITGVMPSWGNGNGAAKLRLTHEKNEFARTSGLSPRDMALAGAAFKGDTESLKNFQKQRDQISSFEQTAQKNIDMFLNAARNVPDSGVPWLNTPIRLLDEKLVGSANMAAVNAARQVANNEIAKVTSGGGLSGVLSDNARHEVDAFNPREATYAQTLAIVKMLKADMENRRTSMDATLNEIRGRVGTMGGAYNPTPPANTSQAPASSHDFSGVSTDDLFKRLANAGK